jgi:hypothetical protein
VGATKSVDGGPIDDLVGEPADGVAGSAVIVVTILVVMMSIGNGILIAHPSLISRDSDPVYRVVDAPRSAWPSVPAMRRSL